MRIDELRTTERELGHDIVDLRDPESGRAAPPERPSDLARRRRITEQDIMLVARVMGDVLGVSGAVLLASFLRFELGWFKLTPGYGNTASHGVAAAFWLISFMSLSVHNRLYDEDTLGGGFSFPRIARTTVGSVALLAVLAMFTHTFDVSRSWFAMVAVFSLTGVALTRASMDGVIRVLQSRGKLRRPALLLSKTGVAWSPTFVEENTEFDVVAHIDPDSLRRYLRARTRAHKEAPRRQDDWQKAAIILRATEFEEDELWRIVMEAGHAGLSVYLHSSVRSVGRDRLTVRELSGTTIVKIAPPRLEGLPAVQKRALDVVGSLFAIMFLSPLLLLLALAVLVTSGRPVLYGQERVGRDGTIFTMWKFRSMRQGAERHTGPVWAREQDPRVTRLGRFLRRSSLDELPQFFNVLVGQMSLVGPRPERPIFVDRFERELAWYQYRHRIRPGLTGWAQAHGLRGNTSIDQRVDFDNWYIEHWSLALDIRVLLRTLGEVVTGRHAY